MQILIKNQPLEQAEKIYIDHIGWGMDQYVPETYANLVYDETGFTIKFVVKETNPQTEKKHHQEAVCQDSCVEFFANFDPEHSDKYLNLEVNAIGTMYAAFRPHRYEFEPLTQEEIKEFHIKPAIEEECWHVSYHISLELLQKKYPGFTMESCRYIKANMYKCGDKNRPKHYLSLFPIETESPDFHRPEYFGVIKLHRDSLHPGSYLFDFDGTLVDSMPSFVSVMLRILDENNINYENDIVKIITPLGYAGTAQYFKKLGLSLSEAEITELMNKYAYEEYAYKIQAKSNVIYVLEKLKKQGADLNILTASPHKVLDPCLKRIGIYDLFTNVWSCDDFSTTKQDPMIYLKVAEKLGQPVGDILFLDDNYNADKTAKSAGMKVCGVFDKSSEDYIGDIKSIADYYIYDFLELLDIG